MGLVAGSRSGIRSGIRSGVNPGGGDVGPSNTHSLSLVRASNQYATIADAAQSGLDFAGTTKGTFGVWGYCETLPGTGEYYTSFGKFASNSGGYSGPQIQENGGGYLLHGVCVGPGNGAYFVNITATLAAQTWIHLAFTFDGAAAAGNRFRFFVNKVDVGIGTVSSDNATQINDATPEFRMGDLNLGGRVWNGLIDDPFICDAVLTEAEIAEVAEQGPKITTRGIKDAWTWDGETFASIINGNVLTPAASSPTFSMETPY